MNAVTLERSSGRSRAQMSAAKRALSVMPLDSFRLLPK